jgi:chemotaxis protein MotB
MTPVMHNKWYVEPEPQEETESWLLTYLDMITLLLVLLVAMLTLSGQVPQKSTVNATSGLLPAHSGLFPGQLDLAAAPAALPPGALPPPLVSSPVPRSSVAESDPAASLGAAAAERQPQLGSSPTQEASTGDPAADILLDAPDYVLGTADPDAILQHVMGSPADSQAAGSEHGSASPETGQPALDVAPLPELGDDIEIIRNKESISFRINSEILYSSAKADLSLEGLAVLRRLVPVFKDSGYAITVEGHTDAVPVRAGRYASNWELSGARAGSVVRYLEANGIESSRLRAIGYADTRPLAGNDTDKGRAANRRVELILDQPRGSGGR